MCVNYNEPAIKIIIKIPNRFEISTDFSESNPLMVKLCFFIIRNSYVIFFLNNMLVIDICIVNRFRLIGSKWWLSMFRIFSKYNSRVCNPGAAVYPPGDLTPGPQLKGPGRTAASFAAKYVRNRTVVNWTTEIWKSIGSTLIIKIIFEKILV